MLENELTRHFGRMGLRVIDAEIGIERGRRDRNVVGRLRKERLDLDAAHAGQAAELPETVEHDVAIRLERARERHEVGVLPVIPVPARRRSVLWHHEHEPARRTGHGDVGKGRTSSSLRLTLSASDSCTSPWVIESSMPEASLCLKTERFSPFMTAMDSALGR